MKTFLYDSRNTLTLATYFTGAPVAYNSQVFDVNFEASPATTICFGLAAVQRASCYIGGNIVGYYQKTEVFRESFVKINSWQTQISSSGLTIAGFGADPFPSLCYVSRPLEIAAAGVQYSAPGILKWFTASSGPPTIIGVMSQPLPAVSESVTRDFQVAGEEEGGTNATLFGKIIATPITVREKINRITVETTMVGGPAFAGTNLGSIFGILNVRKG